MACCHGDQLKRLAEEDFHDEVLIAESRKRIRLRNVERESLRIHSGYHTTGIPMDSPNRSADSTREEGDTEDVQIGSAADKCINFETLLSEFAVMCLSMEPEEILACPLCGEYPDDPIATTCFCLYCTECLTEFLTKTNKEKRDPTCPRAVCEDADILNYLILTEAQWQALLDLWNLQPEDFEVNRELGPGWQKHTLQERPGDVELLWASSPPSDIASSLSGEHSLASSQSGEGCEDLLTDEPEAELSDDGFSLDSVRSVAYEEEVDPDSDTERNHASETCYAIDPRFMASISHPVTDAGAHKVCLYRVPLDESKLLSEETRAMDRAAPRENAETDEGSEPLCIIDLTGDGDVSDDEAPVKNEVASDSADALDERTEDEEEGEYETTECSCEDCVRV